MSSSWTAPPHVFLLISIIISLASLQILITIMIRRCIPAIHKVFSTFFGSGPCRIAIVADVVTCTHLHLGLCGLPAGLSEFGGDAGRDEDEDPINGVVKGVLGPNTVSLT